MNLDIHHTAYSSAWGFNMSTNRTEQKTRVSITDAANSDSQQAGAERMGSNDSEAPKYARNNRFFYPQRDTWQITVWPWCSVSQKIFPLCRTAIEDQTCEGSFWW